MVLPGHIAGAYLVAEALINVIKPDLSASQINALLIIGTLAGELPDIDLIGFYFHGKYFASGSEADHRNYITHAPALWLIVSVVVFLLGLLISSVFVEILALLILAGTWCHFIFDSIEYGVMWLWPYSKKRYSLSKHIPTEAVTARPGTPAAHWQYVKSAYLETWTFWTEVVITLLAIVTFFLLRRQ